MSGDLASAHKCRIKRLSVIFNFDVTAMQTEVYRDKIGHGTTPTVHNSLNWTTSAKRRQPYLTEETKLGLRLFADGSLPDEVGGSIPPQAANIK